VHENSTSSSTGALAFATPGRVTVPRALDMAVARGVWEVRASSQVVYYVDTDACAVLRRPVAPQPADRHQWLLVSPDLVAGARGIIREGDRSGFLLALDADQHWWRQRLIVSIQPATPDAVASLPPRLRHAGQ